VQDIVEDQIAGSADRDDGDLLADEVLGSLDGRIVLDHEQRLSRGSPIRLAEGQQGNAAIGGEKERCPRYAAGVEIAPNDASDWIRAHHPRRHVETFGLEEALLQGQVDDAIVRNREDAKSDVWLFNPPSLSGGRLRVCEDGEGNEEACQKTSLETRTAVLRSWCWKPTVISHDVFLQVTQLSIVGDCSRREPNVRSLSAERQWKACRTWAS